MSTPIAEPRWYHIGPHGFYDLVRLARRGRSTLVRVAYVLALFAALAVVYYQTRHRELEMAELAADAGWRLDRQETINTNARIAERFSITILIMQNIAVLVLMPIYVAASVQEERDTRALPLLFTTDLSAGEIVRGKWVARVGHVGSILLGGLPILSFVQLWGGIDMPMIAANFCNTACWLCSVAAFSLMMATRSRTMISSLVKTYAGLAGMIACISCSCLPLGFEGGSVLLLLPFANSDYGYLIMGLVATLLALIHLGVTHGLLRAAVNTLDAQRGDEAITEFFDEPEVERTAREARPSVWNDALLWKERWVSASPTFEILLPGMWFAFAIYMSLLDILSISSGSGAALSLITMMVSFVPFALLTIFRITGCVAREREQQTLDGLLTLPTPATHLLDAKVRGTWRRYWPWLLPVGVSWLTVFSVPGLRRWACVSWSPSRLISTSLRCWDYFCR